MWVRYHFTLIKSGQVMKFFTSGNIYESSNVFRNDRNTKHRYTIFTHSGGPSTGEESMLLDRRELNPFPWINMSWMTKKKRINLDIVETHLR